MQYGFNKTIASDGMDLLVWSDWIPTVYAAAGVSGTLRAARYVVLGSICHWAFDYEANASGNSGSNPLGFTLPVTPAEGLGTTIGGGRELNAIGHVLDVSYLNYVSTNGGRITLYNTNNGWTNSRRFACGGSYRV